MFCISELLIKINWILNFVEFLYWEEFCLEGQQCNVIENLIIHKKIINHFHYSLFYLLYL